MMKELNLLPNDYKEQLVKNNMLKKFALQLIIFSVIALGLNMLPYRLMQRNQERLAQLEAVIADEKYAEPVEISNRIMDLRSELELYESTYKGLSHAVISDLDTYKQLVAQLPDNVNIDTMTFTNSDRVVIISGVSQSRKLVSEFVSNLYNLQIVNEVAILELELTGRNNYNDDIDFRIQVSINISEGAL